MSEVRVSQQLASLLFALVRDEDAHLDGVDQAVDHTHVSVSDEARNVGGEKQPFDR